MWRDSAIKSREWQRIFRRTPEGKRHVRKMNLRKYGLSLDDYDAMVTQQQGVCAACGQPETASNQFGVIPLSIDHDHETGKIRGLLCMRCNWALGFLGDNPERLRMLLQYMEKY
jgi:hypothetical protein